MLKKHFIIVQITILMFSLVACNNTDSIAPQEIPEVEINNNSDPITTIEEDTAEYEETEAEENIESIAEDNSAYDIENNEEEAHPISKYKAENYPDYIPTDEYWVSDNEFDLVGWYEANGAIPIYFDMYGERAYDDSSNTAVYAGQLVYSYGSWTIMIGSDNYSCVNNSISEDGIVRIVYEYNSKEKNDVVKIKSDVNDFRT